MSINHNTITYFIVRLWALKFTSASHFNVISKSHISMQGQDSVTFHTKQLTLLLLQWIIYVLFRGKTLDLRAHMHVWHSSPMTFVKHDNMLDRHQDKYHTNEHVHNLLRDNDNKPVQISNWLSCIFTSRSLCVYPMALVWNACPSYKHASTGPISGQTRKHRSSRGL